MCALRSWRCCTRAWATTNTGLVPFCVGWWPLGTWDVRAGKDSMTMSKSVSGKARPERREGRSAVSGTTSTGQRSGPAHRSPLTANVSGTSTDVFSQMQAMGHEQVLLSHDPSCGYLGIIAIHDTTLGPA